MRSTRIVEALTADPLTARDLLVAAAPEVTAMAGCPQPSVHHAEGDVLAHSRLREMLRTVDPAHLHAHGPPP